MTNGGATTTVQGHQQTTPATSNTVQTCTALPSLSLRKTANPTAVSGTAPDNTIAYTFTVTNTGPVPIALTAVTDVSPTPAGQVPVGPISCPVPAPTLSPGASTTCTASYTVGPPDITAGEVIDTATATGTYSGTTVTSNRYSAAVDVRPPQPPFTSNLVNTTNTLGLSP